MSLDTLRLTALACMFVLLAPAGLGATETLEGSSPAIIVQENETVEAIDGYAGSMVIIGTVTGNVSGAAGSIHVMETGTVGGSIDAAAGTVRIEGSVGGDVDVAGGTVQVTDTARINGSLSAGGGYVSVDGAVGGEARLAADTLTVGPNTVIGGDLRYNAETFDLDDVATVEGEVIEDSELDRSMEFSIDMPSMPGWVGGTYGLVTSFLAGILLLVAFPRFSEDMTERVQDETLRSAGIGALSLLCVPVGSVLVMMTIVGLPLGLIAMFGFIVAVWSGLIYGQYAIGDWLLDQLGYEDRVIALIAGLLVVAAAGQVPVAGSFLVLAVLLLGLGALGTGLYAVYRDSRE